MKKQHQKPRTLAAMIRAESANQRRRSALAEAGDKEGVARTNAIEHQLFKDIGAASATTLEELRLKFLWMTHPGGPPCTWESCRRTINADLKRFAAALDLGAATTSA